MQNRGRATGVVVILSLCLATVLAPAARAADIFTAYEIPVDAKAKSVAEAREVAIADGQRDGLVAVMRRLTLSADHGRLPPVSQSQAAAMVESIQVEDEKTSDVRYLAKLTIDFNDDKVRRLLLSSGVPFSESQARPTLVLPVLARDGDDLLFEEDNPWLSAWAAYRTSPGSLFPLVVPIGDLEDLAAVDAGLALAGDKAALARIASRYGATNVLVAAARLKAKSLDVSLQWHGPLSSANESQRFIQGGDETLDAALLRAAAGTATVLEERWKRDTLQRAGSAENALDARLPIASLKDWIEARQALEANGMVRRYEVASMTPQSVQLVLHFQGEPEQLTRSLAQNGLELANDGQGWMLGLRQATRGAARE